MEQIDGIPVLKITIEENKNFGVDKISLVDFPAIEEDFLSFSKESENDEIEILKFEVVEEMKLAGAFLIPDKPILRKHPKTGQKFYVIFTKEVIQQIAERFNENQFGGKFNEQHDSDVKDVFVLENWIIDSKQGDKSFTKFGFSYPEGTWFGVVKVKNEDLWNNKIKTGELRGFSVELLAGLKFSIDSHLIEDHALSQMEGLGEVIPKNARLISVQDVDDNEDEFTIEDLEKILNFQVSASPDSDSSLDVQKGDEGKWIVRYRYTGIRDKKNRNFCRKVLNYQNRTGRVFRREDINQMSFRQENSEFGTYSIFKYKGSYGCRHKWERLIYFIDFEDEETRRVGNVPSVTRGLNDTDARTVNSNLSKKEIFNNNIMSEIKSNFEMIEELSPDMRTEGTQVDNPDGDYQIENVTYVVEGGIIVSVTPMEEETPAEETPAEETPAKEEEDAWKMEIMTKIAELESKIEQIQSMTNGTDESSSEQFNKIELEEVIGKFVSELRPATEKKSENQEKKELDKTSQVIFTLNKLKEKK
jgi:hypothetical protein